MCNKVNTSTNNSYDVELEQLYNGYDKFKELLMNREFYIIYDINDELYYQKLQFARKGFLHLVGLEFRTIKKRQMFLKLEQHQLDFKKDLKFLENPYFTRSKLNVIHLIPRVVSEEATLVLNPKQPELSSKNGVVVKLSASNIGKGICDFTVLFINSSNYLLPLSLRPENINKSIIKDSVVSKTVACIAVKRDDKTYTYTYLNSDKFNKTDLPSELNDILDKLQEYE